MSTLDREAAREVLLNWRAGVDMLWALDALEGCVRPVPAQTLDRDALLDLLVEEEHHPGSIERFADTILALLRPVDGSVILTRDEAEYVKRWLPTKNSQRARDLAARLDAAS